MRGTAIAIGALVILGLVAYALLTFRSQPAGEPVGERALRPAPDFTLPDYTGRSVSLRDFRGTPLVVNSWAAWCPFCREELKDFATIQREFGNRVVIIAIDRAEALETARRYTDELGVTDELTFLLDAEDSFYRAIGGFSMPETIFVDADGFIRIHKRGPMPLEEIAEKVQSILN